MVSSEGGPGGTGGNAIHRCGYTPPQWTRFQKGVLKNSDLVKGFVVDEQRDQWAPSRVMIVKDCASYPGNAIRAVQREIQLPFQEVTETLMGPMGNVVVYDVRELLRDIDRLREMVIGIVNCCSSPVKLE